MKCVNCGAENDERNLNCMNCGAELSVPTEKVVHKSKRNMMIIEIVSFILLILFAVLAKLVIMPSIAAQNMDKAFKSKSGTEVISVFEKYCGDYSVDYDTLSRKGKAVFVEFENCVDGAKEDMNSQSAETDINDYLLENLNDIALPQEYSALTVIGEYNVELNVAVMDFYSLYASKISYIDGVTAFNSNNYSLAVSLFSQVTEDDNWYDDAQAKLTESQQKLLEEKIVLIEKYINKGEFDSAQNEINGLRNENLTDEMNKKLDDYENRIYESKLAVIDEYINGGDIEGAKKYIETLGSGLSGAAKERFNQAIKNKANDYISKADEALKNGERQGAYDMAVMAQTLCPNDDEINKKVEYYKEYLPFELYKEKNYLNQNKVQSCWFDYNTKCTANNSDTMLNCVSVSFHPWDSGMYATVTYNLGKKYDIVSGTQFVTQSSKNINQKGYFEIYGDGKKIFTSSVMDVNFLPEKFSVKVTGVDTLIVKYYDDPNPKNGLDYPEYGISNFVATKDLP